MLLVADSEGRWAEGKGQTLPFDIFCSAWHLLSYTWLYGYSRVNCSCPSVNPWTVPVVYHINIFVQEKQELGALSHVLAAFPMAVNIHHKPSAAPSSISRGIYHFRRRLQHCTDFMSTSSSWWEMLLVWLKQLHKLHTDVYLREGRRIPQIRRKKSQWYCA